MEIRELRVFVAVVEEGGMSAAARRLRMGQSTVSETIGALERELGTALLIRSRSGAQPTEPGLALVDGARRLIHLHDRTRATVTASVDGGHAVRLGVPLELPVDFLPQVVASLGRDFPDVSVAPTHRSTTSQWDSLSSDEIDVALVRELVPDDSYDSVLVISEAMGVVLSEERSRSLADPDDTVALDRLVGMRWNSFSRSDSPHWYDHVAATLRSHGVFVPDSGPDDRRPVTPEVKLASVGDGTRFALAAPDFPLARGLRWHRLDGQPLVRRTWAIWPAQSRSMRIAAVVAALQDWQAT